MTQPALSHQILQLEAELGQDLFHRHAPGVTLTTAGSRLLDRAAEIIRQVDGTREELTSTNASPVGTIKVGLATAVNMALSVPLLRECLVRYPRIKLHLIEGMSGFLLEWAERGHVDLAVAYDGPASGLLRSETLGREDLLLIAPAMMAGRLGRSVGPEDLRGIPLILPGFPHLLRHLVDRAATEKSVRLETVADVDSTCSIRKLVTDGLGCAILSRHTVREELNAGTLIAVPIAGLRLHRAVQLVSNIHCMNNNGACRDAGPRNCPVRLYSYRPQRLSRLPEADLDQGSVRRKISWSGPSWTSVASIDLSRAHRHRRPDQREVREGLREVTDLPRGGGIVFLR